MKLPEIELLSEKKFIGVRLKMSFSNNKTFELWQSFMPRRKSILNTVGADLFSIEVYSPSFFKNFNPGAKFEKLAAVEVSDLTLIPEGMEALISPPGLYAVFEHKGPASEGPKTYQYIFGVWLPASDYVLDERPHFAVMGEKYKNNDPDSEENLYIPIKRKDLAAVD